MAQKAVSDFTAREALLNYGFVRNDDGDFYVKQSPVPTQIWRSVENHGWERFDPIASAMPIAVPSDVSTDILPFGVHAADAPDGYVKVPYKPLERFANVGGLHPATHSECYEWIWPEGAVKEIYAYANINGAEWIRTEDGTLERA